MITFNKIRSSFFEMGRIHSLVLTSWSQNSHLLILELHQTDTAVIHRHSHQSELKLHSPVFEHPAPLDLDRTNKRDVGRIFGTIVPPFRARSSDLSGHFGNRGQFLCNVLHGESDL